MKTQTIREALIDNPALINEFTSFQGLGAKFNVTRERARQVVNDLHKKGIIKIRPEWKSGRRKVYETEDERERAKKLSAQRYYNKKRDDPNFVSKRADSNLIWRKNNPDKVKTIKDRYLKNKKDD